MNTLPTLIFIFIVLGYSLWHGFRLRKQNTDLEGFFVMNRRLHARALGTSFAASNISVATVVLSLGVVGYTYGFIGGVWITLCWVSGTVFFTLMLRRPRMREYLRVGHTLHEFIGEYYDKPGKAPIMRLTAAFLTLLVYWAALGIEFFAGVIVFTKLAGTPSPIVIALIIAVIIIVYTVRGGYAAATLSDRPRLSLVAIGFTLIAVLSILAQINTPSTLSKTFVDFSRFDPTWAAAVIFTMVPFHLSALDMWQRGVAAGGNVPAISRGLIRSLPICVLWLVPAYVGSLAAALGAQPDNINYVVLNLFDYTAPYVNVQLWEYVFQPLIYGSLVATLASTGDSLLITMIFTFTYDVYGTFKKIDFAALSESEKGNLLSKARYWTGLLGLSSVLIVLIGTYAASLYDLIIASFSIQIILFWPVLFALVFTKREFIKMRTLAFLGLIAGLSTAGLMVGIYIYQLNLTGKGSIYILNSAPIGAFFVTLFFYLTMLLFAPTSKKTDSERRPS